MCFKVILLSYLILQQVTGTPLVIRTGLQRLENHNAHQTGNLFDGKSQSGIANFEADAGFNNGNEKKYTVADDRGAFVEDDRKKAHQVDAADFGKEKFHSEGGGAVSDVGQKSGHKKGHHKQGFHNTYHKDESGSNSSYFDDSNDQGDAYTHDTKKNDYAGRENARNQGSYLDGNAYNKENGRTANYANGGNYAKDNSDRRNYNNERYYDDQKAALRNNAAKVHGANGRQEAEEVRYERPYYHDNYGYNNYEETPFNYYQTPYNRNNYYDNPKITIYEDPGYSRFGRQDRFRDGDFEQYYEPRLDVRPPTVQPYTHDGYYDRRPTYNDNYYTY